MKLSFLKRKTGILSPSTLECFRKGVATINPTMGCAHHCAYCYARGYSLYPGDHHVAIYDNLTERLKKELDTKRRLPGIVFFSTACDAFQPIPQVLKTTYEIMLILLDRGIKISFLTKGRLPSRFLKLFEHYSSLVHAKIGLITTDRRIQQIFEPYAANPQERLKNVKELTQRSIDTEVRMDPIIPGLTDNYHQLNEYFATLRDLNVKSIGLNYLFLRNQIKKNIRKALVHTNLYEKILSQYKGGKRLALKAEGSHVYALDDNYRRIRYETISHIASIHGIKAYICGCKNPDIIDNMVCGTVLNTFSKKRNEPSLMQLALDPGTMGTSLV